MKKYDVNISKNIVRYYTYKIEALNEEDAVNKVNDMIANRQIRDEELMHTQDEPDYSIEDEPDAYTVVDAHECE